MAETAEILNPEAPKLSPKDIWPWKKKLVKEEKKEFIPPLIRDESKPTGEGLSPQENTIVQKNRDYATIFKEEFDYMSRTRGLETGTERTKILQDLVDKMTAGDIKTRVVITNRGRELQASTTAEGTIFISQSMLNKLESMDEVAGVLAHEVGHLVFQTFEKAAEAGMRGKICEFGVGWIHEAASDINAPALLEKAGLRSSAFIDAIKTISGGHRGTIHQSGLSRAAQNIMLHGGIDYETSGSKSQEMPQILKTDGVEPTNLEVFKEALDEEATEYLEKLASSLHPRDFKEAYELTKKQDFRYYTIKQEILDRRVKMLESVENVARKRFEEKGYTKNEIDLFFLLDEERRVDSFRFIDSPDRLIEVVNGLKEFVANKKIQEMADSIFGTDYKTSEDLGNKILGLLQFHTYDVDHMDSYSVQFIKYNFPVTQETMINVLSLINQLPEDAFSAYSPKDKAMAQVLSQYIKNIYRGQNYKGENKKDREKVRNFLTKIRDAGINVNPKDGEITYYKKVFHEIFSDTSPDIKSEDLRELMNHFVVSYTNSADSEKQEIFEKFVKKFTTEIKEQKFDDAKILLLLQYMGEKIDKTGFDAKYSILTYLAKDQTEPKTEADLLNDKILKYNLKTAIALETFKKDSNEFYAFLKDTFAKSGLDPKTLTRIQLINLCDNLLSHNTELLAQNTGNIIRTYTFDSIAIRNFSQLLKFPLMEHLINLQDNAHPTTIKELDEYLSDLNKGLATKADEIFDDEPLVIFLGKNARQAFAEILNKGIDESEYGSLFSLIEKTFPYGPDKNEIQREVNRQYLLSNKVSVKAKIDHFERWEFQLGLEGALMVADQIKTLPDYLYFRKQLKTTLDRYLSGESKKTSELAVADNASTEVVKDFKFLLDTTKNDLNSKRVSSSRLAELWSKTINVTKRYIAHEDIEYDKKSGKIAFTSKTRRYFRTLSDVIRTLKGLSSSERFAISQKALLDQDGALTTPENRKLLGKTLVDALNPSSSFIRKALNLAATDAPADFISIPASQMLSGLLFKGLDINFVSPTSVSIEGIPRVRTLGLIRSTTKEATLFGPQYIKDPNSLFARLARESNLQFEAVNQKTREILNIGNAIEKTMENPQKSVDSSTEAIIKGVEMTGALGVRSLQLARQLHRFPENVDKRLSQAFDARPGLSKLLFWENLVKMSQNGNGVKAFTDRLVSLDGYLGGGSLYTTFAGTVKNANGTTSEVAIKMLNPNQEMFIQQPYKIVGDILTKIESEGKAEDKQYSRMAQLFLTMSNDWCLKDIGDPTFEKDDDEFEKTISAFNKLLGSELFYKPERVFNSYKIKSEQLAQGRTLNQVLNDSSIPNSQKKVLVEAVKSFFEYQTKTLAPGKNYFLIHSDPHVGNFMVDLSSGEPKIGVIDRNMYLKLDKEDVALFQPLMEGENYGSMLEPMIERLLDRNKIISEGDRKAIRSRILFGVRGEFVVQTWKSLKRLKIKPDNFAILRRFMGEAANSGLAIPLEYQLMIRNIEAFRGLQKRYASKSS